MSILQEKIAFRAAVSLNEDFRSGLSSWEGSRGWARSWSFDAAGFVRPGQLAIYQPTCRLSDYSIEFLAQIESRALSWVFRAADPQNYQAARILITRGGPLPQAVVEHWAVIRGREDRRRSLPLPLQLREDTLYRVALDARGDTFVLKVQDQMVDTWEDSRLQTGGIGFFSGRGEQSRIRWLTVNHQNDTLGRLCALLSKSSGKPQSVKQKD